MTPTPAVLRPPPVATPPPIPVGSVTAGALVPLLDDGRSPTVPLDEELEPTPVVPVPARESLELFEIPVPTPPLSVDRPPAFEFVLLDKPAVPSDVPSAETPSVARSGVAPCTAPDDRRSVLLPIEGAGVTTVAPAVSRTMPPEFVPSVSIVSGTPVVGTPGSPGTGVADPGAPPVLPGVAGLVPAVVPPVLGIVGDGVPAVAPARAVPAARKLGDCEPVVLAPGETDPARAAAPPGEPPRDMLDPVLPPELPELDCASAGTVPTMTARAAALMVLVDSAHMTRASCNSDELLEKRGLKAVVPRAGHANEVNARLKSLCFPEVAVCR